MKDFNFFEPYLKIQKNKKRKIMIIVMSSIVLIAFVSTIYAINYFRIEKLSTELKEKEAIINSEKSKALINEVENDKNKYNLLEAYAGKLQNISKYILSNDKINNELMEKLSSVLPQNVYYKSLSISKEGVQIQCTAKSNVEVGELLHNLKALGIFEKVYTPGVAPSGTEVDSELTFSVVCTLKGGENNDK